jgi:spermidine synthase
MERDGARGGTGDGRGAVLNLVSVGGLGIATQLVLLRELLASFGGNELAAGVTLAAWVLFEAAGAWIAGRARPGGFDRLAVLSILASLAAAPMAVAARSLFGALPGETASVSVLLAVSAAVTLLPAATHGMLFVAATGLLSESRPERGGNPVGLGYTWEGTGTVAAGIACFFLLSRLPGLAVIALFAVPAIVAAYAASDRSAAARVACVATAVAAIFAFAAAGPADRLAWAVAWRGQRVESVRNTPYGKIVNLERSGQHLVAYDGVPVAAAPASDPVRTGELALLPLLLHPQPRSVLVLGSDFAVGAAAARSFPAVSVQTVLLDTALGGSIVATLATDSSLAPIAVRLVPDDPARFLASTKDRFDCIILTDAAPARLGANRFFSTEFYRLCRKRLTAGGLLASATPGDPAALSADAANQLSIRARTLKAAFPDVAIVAADFPMLVGSNGGQKLDPSAVTERLNRLGCRPAFLDSAYVTALLDPFRQQSLLSALEAAPSHAPMSEAGPPTELLLNMVRENRLSSPGFGRLYERLGRTPSTGLWWGVGLLVAAGLAGSLAGGVRFSRGFGVLTSGFAGTAVVTLAVFGYEARFGSVYSGMSLLVVAFMLGTVGGGLTGVCLSRRDRTGIPFLSADLALAACAAALLVPARFGPATFLAVNLAAGAALGIQYSVAGSAGPARRRAGQLAALDLAGGFAAGVLVSLFIAPAFGVTAAAATVVAMKLASAASQLVGGRFLDSAGRSPRMAA